MGIKEENKSETVQVEENKLKTVQVEAVTGDKREHRVVAHNGPDLVFRGVETVRVTSTSVYSKDTFQLYVTESARYVGVKTHALLGDPISTALVLENAREVIAFFGHCPMAKKLYELASIQDLLMVP